YRALAVFAETPLRFRARPRVSPAIAANSAFVWIFSPHCERDSAARGELSGHNRFAWRARFHKIVENTIRDRFIKRSLSPVRSEIKFERLAFHAKAVRHVVDIDPGEIGLAGERTNGREIIRFKMNAIIPPRWIMESFEPRLIRRRGQFRLASSET